MRFFDILFSTTAQVFHFRFDTQHGVAFASLGFGKLNFQIRNFSSRGSTCSAESFGSTASTSSC